MNRRQFLAQSRSAGAAIAAVGASQKQQDDAHRLKIVRMDTRSIVDLLNARLYDMRDMIALPVMDGIPEDAEVVSVRENWQLRALEVMIQHPSFDVVPDGDLPPVLPGIHTEWRHIPFSALKERAKPEEG